MDQEIKIALLQTTLIWENPEANRAKFTQNINALPDDIDVIVLPEMFTTGFTMHPKNIETSEDDITLMWMQQMAAEKNAALVGSLIFREKDLNYNRLFFVEPNGTSHQYDKRHTFTLAGEHEIYEPGLDKLIVAFRGLTFCPLICYDLRFPVWSRNTEFYDVLLYVANWPTPRVNAWDALLKARAIENMAYCIGVNRVGDDNQGYQYSGHSGVYDVLGQQLTFSEQEEVLITILSRDHIQQNREKLKFLEDADEFNLI